jgi:hypothetical protein
MSEVRFVVKFDSLALHDFFCMPLIKTHFICAFSSIFKQWVVFTFSDLFTHRKQLLWPSLDLFPLQTAHSTHFTHLPPFYFTSLHRTSRTRQPFSTTSFSATSFSTESSSATTSRHQNHQQPLFHLSDNHLFHFSDNFPSSKHLNHLHLVFLVFLLNKLDSFNKLQGFGTIRVCTHQSPFLKTITNTQEVQIQVPGGEQGIINISTSQHFSSQNTQLLRKECPALHHQHLAICLNSRKNTPTQITAIKRENSPPLLSSAPHQRNFSPLPLPTLLILLQQTHSPFFSALLSPLSIFLRAELLHERKVVWLAGFSTRRTLRTITVFCFLLVGFGISQRLSSQCNFFFFFLKTWEKLQTPHFEMEDSTWDFLLYPSLRETEQIGVSFEFVSPAIIQLFLSWKKKTPEETWCVRKYRTVWGVGKKQNSSAFDVCYWQKSFARWFGNREFGRGTGGGVSAYGHWDLLRRRSVWDGSLSLLVWFEYCTLFWGIWWGGGGEFGVLTELRVWDCKFWRVLSSLEGQACMVSHTRQKRHGYQGVLSGTWAFFVFWTLFWQGQEGCLGILIVLEKNNKPHFTTFLFPSFTLHARRQQKAVLPASYLQHPETRQRDQLLRDRSARNRQPLHTPKLFPLSPPKQRQLRSP